MEGRRSSSEIATASWMRWLLEDSHSNTREKLGGSWELVIILMIVGTWYYIARTKLADLAMPIIIIVVVINTQ